MAQSSFSFFSTALHLLCDASGMTSRDNCVLSLSLSHSLCRRRRARNTKRVADHRIKYVWNPFRTKRGSLEMFFLPPQQPPPRHCCTYSRLDWVIGIEKFLAACTRRNNNDNLTLIWSVNNKTTAPPDALDFLLQMDAILIKPLQPARETSFGESG
jgi:hypothetical protein